MTAATAQCARAPSRSCAWMRMSAEPDAAKMVSQSAMQAMRSGMRRTSNSTSGNSSRSASARGRLRFRTVTRPTPLLARCFTSSRDILPAPMMHTCGAHAPSQTPCKRGQLLIPQRKRLPIFAAIHRQHLMLR